MGTTTTASHKTVVLVRSGLVVSAPRSAPIATESVTFATSASDKNGVCLLRIAANPSKKRLPHPQSEQMDPFKWWLFLSNLGPNTRAAFGTGITSVQIHKREDKIELRTEHTDSSVQWIILTPHRTGCKTQLVTELASIALLESIATELAIIS